MESENIWKTWKGHAGFGCLAFDVLPAWQKGLFKPDMSPAALAKPYLPRKGILSPREKTGFLCQIMDLIYYDECRPYATFPDGRWIPHAPPDDHGQAAVSSGESPSPAVSVEIIEILMNKMIEAVLRDDWEEAIRHGGALGHFVQEPFTPGHAINCDLLQQILTRLPLHPGREVQTIEVDITGARSLMLISECSPYKDIQGLLKWDVPHVAVCEPALSKIMRRASDAQSASLPL